MQNSIGNEDVTKIENGTGGLRIHKVHGNC
jgi:hypothetical protein